ncbi:MAG TPA: patatin-like phospholipase family protein [Burkholderiales bacterium]|nr:patatin-like phospholipase family protein [Burkholderiales bacterium]
MHGSEFDARPRGAASAARRTIALACATLLASACASTYQPWINEASAPPAATAKEKPSSKEKPSYWSAVGGANNARDMYFVVAFSGGGMRAAALAYGVLEALRDARFDWDGRSTTLLDQVDVLSGVSGGGLTAAYYAAYGAQTFSAYKRQFLLRDFDSDLLSGAMAPETSYRMSSPWFGRGNVLAEQLDRVLFHGMTYGQLRNDRSGPTLFLTATDLSLGTSFEFTPDQFRLMCSDLRAVPLAVAAAASSAVPVVFAPITLKNYAGPCSSGLPPGPQAAHPSFAQRKIREYLAEQDTYRDRALRPYIHLVDGGLADNLGLRRIAQDIEMAGGLGPALEHGGATGVKKIIFLSVDAERKNTFAADQSGDVPSLVAMFHAIEFGFLSHNTTDTYDQFAQTMSGWRSKIQADLRSGQGPFAPGVKVYDIEVGLRSYPEAAMRKALMDVPTSFALAPAQVDETIAAGPKILEANPEYRRLLRDLEASADAPRLVGAVESPRRSRSRVGFTRR